MDGIISQFDRSYLSDIQLYAKVLEQRNSLLKNMAEHQLFDQESIEVWDHQLIEYGSRIYDKRKTFIDEFIPVFQRHYDQIGNTEEKVALEYRSQLHEAQFDALLEMNRRRDAITRYTNSGIHRDDLVFQIKENPIKRFGSQGQQKSYLIALRLAQYEWLKNHLNTLPVLLLDDIFDNESIRLTSTTGQ